MKPLLIMTCWNNLHLTKIAISTIFKNTTIPYDLHIINNGSNDGTEKWLTKLEPAGECEKIILTHNKTNEGNIKPVNKAIKSTSQDVVLLNNDMEFPYGWLRALRDVAYKRERTGIVGARLCYNPIFLNFRMDFLKKNYSEEEIGRLRTMYHTVNLGCSWVKRKLIKSIGLLDEGYGLGFVEDDDYCIRATIAGWKLDYAEVFIRHVGTATFNNIVNVTEKLWATNREYFNNKWNPKGIAFMNGDNTSKILRHDIDECKVRLDAIDKKLNRLLDKFDVNKHAEITY